MAGTSDGHSTGSDPPKKPTKAETRERLTRDLDERDAFIARESEKASKGLKFNYLHSWGIDDQLLAMKIPEVWQRYHTQFQKADRELVRREPAQRTLGEKPGDLVANFRQAGSPNIASETEPSKAEPKKESYMDEVLRRKGLQIIKSSATDDEIEDGVRQTHKDDVAMRIGLGACEYRTDAGSHGRGRGAYDPFRGRGRGRETAPSTRGGLESERGGDADSLRGSLHGNPLGRGRGIPNTRGDTAGRAGQSTRNQLVRSGEAGRGATPPQEEWVDGYPLNWSRWAGDLGIDSGLAHLDNPDGTKETVKVEKLDPSVYGGDKYHDLGLCKQHFTKGTHCPVPWEHCPLRHWAIEWHEQRWVKPSWLKEVREMDLRPRLSPDNRALGYKGLPRLYVDGVTLRAHGRRTQMRYFRTHRLGTNCRRE